MVRQGTYDRVLPIIEEPEAVIQRKGSRREYASETVDLSCEAGYPGRWRCLAKTAVTEVVVSEGGTRGQWNGAEGLRGLHQS